MDRGSDGRTLGHKRLYCAQCASNADIGKLLAPFLGFAPNPPTDHHSSRKPKPYSYLRQSGKISLPKNFNWKRQGKPN
ncbi:hypothetical protein QLX08_000413 [Tetragonisca angustula]|uniref:Uncharacterized protein n=1 Tax=Tetragonisca angustula TaxID=166442 RepID=A0AAW1ALT0_9HYME